MVACRCGQTDNPMPLEPLSVNTIRTVTGKIWSLHKKRPSVIIQNGSEKGRKKISNIFPPHGEQERPQFPHPMQPTYLRPRSQTLAFIKHSHNFKLLKEYGHVFTVTPLKNKFESNYQPQVSLFVRNENEGIRYDAAKHRATPFITVTVRQLICTASYMSGNKPFLKGFNVYKRWIEYQLKNTKRKPI